MSNTQAPTPIKKEDYPTIKETKDDSINSYVAFDLETTGLYPSNDSIIEIGAIKVIDGNIVESDEMYFQEFVRPYRKQISAQVQEITGITPADVEDARQMWEVIPDFMEFVGDLPLLGFNSIFFDCKFLERAGRYSHIYINNPCFDVINYANQFKKGFGIKKRRCSLKDMSDALGIVNPRAHRALADAITTAKVYQGLKAL
ncbi:MAG: 3'-5' exonuclease [Lachnospiraceae bacterium]|nr:3'-5' exonuclease [Lachnospiraceae bacterium]